LAEAWHVDGFYRRAARLWRGLPTCSAGFLGKPIVTVPQAERALKVASALLSIGELDEGERWLAAAERAGAARDEIHYLRGRALAEQAFGPAALPDSDPPAEMDALSDITGAPSGLDVALSELDAAYRASPRRGRALNAAGVALWRAGRRDEAVAVFARALEADPDDADAMVNRATTGRSGDRAEALLAEAIRRQPHRHEAFVALSRLASRAGDQGRATDLLARARLRTRWLGTVPTWTDVATAGRPGIARVEGTLAPTGVDLTVRFAFPPGRRPRALVVNAAYLVEVNGRPATLPAGAAGRRHGGRVAAPTKVVPVPPSSTGPPSGIGELVVRLVGTPLPPGCSLSPDALEFDEVSGWLPLAEPALPLRWEVRVSVPTGMTVRVSQDTLSLGAVGLLATRPANRSLTLPGPEGSSVVVEGSGDALLLGAAARWAVRAADAWTCILGSRPIPPIVVVDRPNSRYGYARQGYLRLASGMVRDPVQVGQVAHEVGHVWWGVATRFTPQGRWLAEALAEYTHHLLEDRGLERGYRSRTLTELSKLDGGALARLGLATLATRADPAAMFALRAKGGFVIGMLREVMGDRGFTGLLRAAFDVGARHRLDVYSFFALASWRHGRSLRWFANQWVYADTALDLTATETGSRRAGAAGVAVAVEVRLRGAATCGAPVTIAVEDTAGTTTEARLWPDSGTTLLTLTVPAAPRRIVVDPASRWFVLPADRRGGSHG
jgi:tetratricopeptide (TPR) repeat protein